MWKRDEAGPQPCKSDPDNMPHCSLGSDVTDLLGETEAKIVEKEDDRRPADWRDWMGAECLGADEMPREAGTRGALTGEEGAIVWLEWFEWLEIDEERTRDNRAPDETRSRENREGAA
ncbi:hypothetical protein F503_02432 [Ophiostoma piceae UAMH 11346]|uniref:Uncharacterized protein n=1 Tax=Ophiostoma piceae (strain UAMH 11346) TaxID=1262450 RepID=S3BYI3_OPHP1|nr:hypothetical protein F503_02432 [Ophiostoma piceae UAMH 11346]